LLVGGNISHILDTTTLDVSHEQKFMIFYGDIQGGPFKYVYLDGLVTVFRATLAVALKTVILSASFGSLAGQSADPSLRSG
jgi:hypothetical protein